jgi:hypothetical protein
MKATIIREEKLLTCILVFIVPNGIYKTINRKSVKVNDAKSTSTHTDPPTYLSGVV